jgi:hypothetical protein
VANSLKTIITEDVVRVEAKFVNHYTIENLASVLCFTNHRRCLAIENGDRRWFMVATDVNKRTPDYYAKLRAWLDGDGTAIVCDWLLKRDVSAFNPDAPAPMTAAKVEAIEDSQGDDATTILEWIAEKQAPLDKDIVLLRELCADLRRHDIDISRTRLGEVIRQAGGGPIRLDGSTPYRVPSGEQKFARLWALRDLDKWRAATDEERGAAYFDPFRGRR